MRQLLMGGGQKSWTLDDSALASNPAQVRVSPLRWLRHYPAWPTFWMLSFLLCAALAWLVKWEWGIIAVMQFISHVIYWLRVRDHFRYGNVNEAVVISEDPMLIAVAVDLSKGFDPYPAIKIIRKSLATVRGQVPHVGSRLAAVALYTRGPDEGLPHWVDCDPRPLDCATGDLKAIERVMRTISDEDWQQLRSWLKQVPRPFRCGLYHVQPDE